MANSKVKTLHVAYVSIAEFFRRHHDVYFWSFTEPGRRDDEILWTKDQAEAAFKPFRDYCDRRGIELLVFWELQQRGSWHVHCLIDRRLDVNIVRPWMVARGWGPQMRVDWLPRRQKMVEHPNGRIEWVWERPGAARVVRYLTKYLTKSIHGTAGCAKKKVFGGSRNCKAGGTSFRWVPWVKPGAFLYAAGLEMFRISNGRPPSFRDVSEVIRFGVEVTGWAAIDPWWTFGFPLG